MTDTLPTDPSEFQSEKPPCIRAAMMEYAVYDIRADFSRKLDLVIADFMRANSKLDRPTAFMLASRQLDERLNPYIEASENIMRPYRTTLSNAQDLERQGQLEGAIVLYEKLVEACFPAPFPYERLRILYTKQKRYHEAVVACQNYIFALKMLSFENRPQHIKQIDDYEEHIEKLKAKMGKNHSFKISDR